MFLVDFVCPLNRESVAVRVGRHLERLPPYAATVPCASCGLVHRWGDIQIQRTTPKGLEVVNVLCLLSGDEPS